MIEIEKLKELGDHDKADLVVVLAKAGFSHGQVRQSVISDGETMRIETEADLARVDRKLVMVRYLESE